MNAPLILVVDDDEWLAEQHARVLRLAGFKVVVASHALAAIYAVDEALPNVIVLDMLLTGSTAVALMHELQSYGDTGRIPIILCTNMANELEFNDLKPYGVEKILDKTSMLPDDLVAAVRRVL
jgi:two-component system phosphate regulon response regulator PhoB